MPSAKREHDDLQKGRKKQKKMKVGNETEVFQKNTKNTHTHTYVCTLGWGASGRIITFFFLVSAGGSDFIKNSY